MYEYDEVLTGHPKLSLSLRAAPPFQDTFRSPFEITDIVFKENMYIF